MVRRQWDTKPADKRTVISDPSSIHVGLQRPREPIMKLKPIFCAAVCAVLSLQASACYTVYDRNNQVVYDAQTAPVDMRYQIHETLPRVFPGGHMVFGNSTDCPVTQERAPRAGDAVARLGNDQRINTGGAMPGSYDRDAVFTEPRDPPAVPYGRIRP